MTGFETVLQVCLPGLHMTLGIYDRLWELLEGECTKLDLLLAEHTPGGETGTSYDQYVTALRKREQLSASLVTQEQRATLLEQLVTYFSLNLTNAAQNQQLLDLRQEASKARLRVTELVKIITTLIQHST